MPSPYCVFCTLRIAAFVTVILPRAARADSFQKEAHIIVSGVDASDVSCESRASVAGGRALLQSGAEAKAKVKLPKLNSGAAPAPAPHGLGLLAGAPNEALVKAHVKQLEEKAKLEASGDELHYSTHGCHCLNEWTWEGEPQSGCSKVATSFNHDWPWCKVTELCEKYEGKVEDDELWDFCTMKDELDHHRTMHGCHCNGRFEHDGEIWEGCSKTSKGPTWCYVFEGGVLCSEALKTEHHGQHWDYCFLEEDTQPYLTRNGCHCMPWFIIGDEKYEGCTRLPGKDTPGCYVYEDETLCPGISVVEGTNFFYDECTVPTGEEESVLQSLDYAQAEGCHCMPEWKYQGVFYKGCTSTPDGKEDWCFVLQDDRMCKDVHGEEDGSRWRYCGADALEIPPLESSESQEQPVEEPTEERKVEEDQTPAMQINVIPVVIPTAGSGNVRLAGENAEGSENATRGIEEAEGAEGLAKGAGSRFGGTFLVRWAVHVTVVLLGVAAFQG